MKSFGIVEVGSTNTKGYMYMNSNIHDVPFVNIEFKKNYKENNCLKEYDKQKLYDYVLKIKGKVDKVYTYGTSIFRNLTDKQKTEFIEDFKNNTGCSFEVVSSEKENEYTVYGAITGINYDKNIAVMIGGGGSTEIAICNNGKILEMANTSFGVSDTFEKYPDLNDKYAVSSRDEIVEFIKGRLNKPKLKADILILAGGDFILSHTSAKYPLLKNKMFENQKMPYIIPAQTRNDHDLEFYYNINLDDMRKFTPDNPNWWNGTRAMCSFAKCV